MSTKEVVDILKCLSDGITKHGVGKTLSYLKLMNIDYDDTDKKNLIDYIITKVCLHYRVSVEDLLFTKKRGDVTTAKKMCVCLLCNYVEMAQVKDVLSITYQLVFIYYKKSPMVVGAKSAKDLAFIMSYEQLFEIIENFRKSLGFDTLN